MELNVIQKIAVFAWPVLFAMTLHEAAHGYVAKHFGDMTAYSAGRVSLNPLRHIDLVGTIIVPLVSLLVADILFGWAKPVPVQLKLQPAVARRGASPATRPVGSPPTAPRPG